MGSLSIRWSTFWLVVNACPLLLATPLREYTDPQVWYCSNAMLKSTIKASLSNTSLNVDEIQAYLEARLLPYFNEHNGKWLISASKFHRLSGYVDDEAKNRQTFCAMHEITKDIHIVIVKVE